MQIKLLTIFVIASIIASSSASLHSVQHHHARMIRVAKRQGSDDSYGASPAMPDDTMPDDSYGTKAPCPEKDGYGSPGGDSRNSPESVDPSSGGSSSSNQKPQCTYSQDDQGNWVLSEMPDVDGCPHQIVPPGGGGGGGDGGGGGGNQQGGDSHGCNVVSTPALIGVSALNCAHICILTNNCQKIKPCNVVSNGSIINVSALNCADVKILAQKRK